MNRLRRRVRILALAVAGGATTLVPVPAAGADPEVPGPERECVARPSFSLIWDGSLGWTAPGPRRSAGRALIDAGVGLDLDAALGWRGFQAYAGVLALRGKNGDGLVEEVQPHSSIDADPFEDVVAWVEFDRRDRGLRIRAGRMDANQEFAVVESGVLFLNSSAGLTPILDRLPTYPRPTAGVHAVAELGASWRVAAGLHEAGGDADGRESRTFAIGEVRRSWGRADDGGRLAWGFWRRGGYAAVEQAWVPSRGIRSIRAFAQYGHSPSGSSPIDRHAAVGVVARGYARRDGDSTGLLVSRASIRDAPSGPRGAETVVELFHRIQVSPWLAVQPDLQRVAGPAGSGTDRRRWVATIRLEILFPTAGPGSE